MLSFIGLGLYDEQSITCRGKRVLEGIDTAFVEWYTSILAGTTVETLEDAHDVDIVVRDRAGVEQDPGPILDAATDDHVAFLTAGDTMISTTHVDLRLRADDQKIDTEVIHGTTAQTAASSLTGLQNYRFGKATTLPFEETHGGVPGSVVDTIEKNRDQGLHTLVYLDIDGENETYLTGDEAAGLLADELDNPLGVVVAQAGSDDPTVRADRLSALGGQTFGPPLHLLVIPGERHPIEKDALTALAGAPPGLV